MNIYGCQTWRYNSNYVDKFYTTWRNAISEFGTYHIETHNKLVHLINKSCSIRTVLEKRSIKFIWTLKTLCKEKKKSFSFYIDNILIKTSSI